ncbi:Rpp14/Pop5 family protein [Nitzschia inconspicua]|uniref:Rpp14/Pop5 family protein n=1 Tax=Nitzschia inconspicua TaxID=303405 RepID=A0A9K3K8S5_9STRA|nr:Rpp14/Pop5 family protein [Nitzschia inconspicua]KAG7340414.1 Rpp14/Pop5 family protein [Nitzschia inconspicua]
MVRFKTRWLLVKFDVMEDPSLCRSRSSVPSSTASSKSRPRISRDTNVIMDRPMLLPSKKEFVSRLRRTIVWSFGLSGEPINAQILVKFYDASNRLALIRCPRKYCDKVRAAVTLLLTPQQHQQLPTTLEEVATASGGSNSNNNNNGIVCSIQSIHGSARTAKIATIRMLRSIYQQKLKIAIQEEQQDKGSPEAMTKKLCQKLQDLMGTIQSIN